MYYLLGQDYKTKILPMHAGKLRPRWQRHGHGYVAEEDAYYDEDWEYDDFEEEAYYEETDGYDYQESEIYDDPFPYEQETALYEMDYGEQAGDEDPQLEEAYAAYLDAKKTIRQSQGGTWLLPSGGIGAWWRNVYFVTYLLEAIERREKERMDHQGERVEKEKEKGARALHHKRAVRRTAHNPSLNRSASDVDQRSTCHQPAQDHLHRRDRLQHRRHRHLRSTRWMDQG